MSVSNSGMTAGLLTNKGYQAFPTLVGSITTNDLTLGKSEIYGDLPRVMLNSSIFKSYPTESPQDNKSPAVSRCFWKNSLIPLPKVLTMFSVPEALLLTAGCDQRLN